MRKKRPVLSGIALSMMAFMMAESSLPYLGTLEIKAAPEEVTVEETENGYRMKNGYFDVETGKYGEITSLKIVGDEYDTNYVMNVNDNPQQDTPYHEWLGDLMFKTKKEGEENWTESLTNSSDEGRTVELDGNKVVVTYDNTLTEGDLAIKDFKLVETYSLVEDQLRWEITVENTTDGDLIFGDFGVPLAFHEIWVNQGEAYEQCTVDHSFVGKDSSYVYVTRPSGEGRFLLMTPDTETGAGFEYQDHWQVSQRRPEEKEWCMDQADWANGLNVFYIHSDAISQDEASGNKGYMESSSMTLGAGESKTYAFNFTAVSDEDNMKSVLYEEGIMDAVAVPGMTFARNMPAKMYLYTEIPQEDISFAFRCPHTNNLHQGTNTVSNNLPCERTEENTYANYLETKVIDGEQYHIYEIGFGDLGQNDIIVNYKQNGQDKMTMLQFYMMDDLDEALSLHSDFLLGTQWDAPGAIQDKVFDDWMMDTKSKRGAFDGYWGWGDDWGYVHGEFLAEMNTYNPVAEQVQALDEYLDVAIWQNLMQEHQEDYLIHDFLMEEPNSTPTYRGFAYPHIYNTYFSMYEIAVNYPDLIDYTETADTYLLRCYNIMNALYNGEGVGYNWNTGLMGESTTPEIIQALKDRGYEEEAANLEEIMETKFNNFANDKYPYISEYPYDNTSEEAVYTMAKMFGNSEVMSKVDAKTRACRGVQPIWYHYGNPTTICGENWFNFQYTASLAGYCMDDWIRMQDNGMSDAELGEAQRINYAGKLANFTVINSGQIDADPENIGTVAWTYQAEMGNDEALGTGGGKLHNGWRQMSGEADLALFGAIRIASSDVAVDPVFGLTGYGCEVTDNGGSYSVTPLDGVYHRLNLINEKVSLELTQDQYSSAVVSKDGSSITLDMINVTGTAHESPLNITGIPAGDYQVKVNGELAGSFTADGQTTKVAIPLSEGTHMTVTIEAGNLLEDTTPVVDAGEDMMVAIEDQTVLHGTARDAAWLHTEPAVEWTVEEKPAGAEVTFGNSEKTSTKVTFSTAGEYILKLTATGKSNTAEDTVKITVEGISELPETIARYDFEQANIDTENKEVKDTSGSGVNAELKGNVELAQGRDSETGIAMSGQVGGYVKLTGGLTKYTQDATISLDVKLNGNQTNGTRLFEFGDMEENLFYVAFESANELSLNVTDMETGELETAKSGVLLNEGTWQNVEVTLTEDKAELYVNGEPCAQIEAPGFAFNALGDVQRNFLGRSYSESTPWLNGSYDNFVMMSRAMTEEELKAAYGSGSEAEVTDISISSVITSVGVEPSMPRTARVEYSNGLSRYENVTWEPVDESLYAQKGEFEAVGRIEALDLEVSTTVQVVEGKEQNLALAATPTAIIDTPQDLGGVAGLNDGYDPANSNDRTHGVWHNWLGDQTGEAWVQYTWDSEVLITGTDAYYYTDGNFVPASVVFQYLDENGEWQNVVNGDGFGTELDQYNTTTFSPVRTTAFRMIMTPKTLGCGVIEWKVYGYSDEAAVDKQLLKTVLDKAQSLDMTLFEEGAEEILNAAVAEAQAVYDNKEASQEEVDAAAAKLGRVIVTLPTADGNLAYSASASTSFVSSWESLDSVKDGQIPENSFNPAGPRYGTWGNTSDAESITYTWNNKVTLDRTEIYFWYDGETTTTGGINLPSAYVYEYLDEEGNWTEVPNASGMGTEIDGFNETVFDPITTTSIRVTMTKQANDGNGVGVMEWKVYGAKADVDKSALEEAVAQAEALEQGNYTQESWEVFQKALADAKAVLIDPEVSAEEVEGALAVLTKAQGSLTEIPQEGLRNLAPAASSEGICDYVEDLGGLAALNDGAEPTGSGDTSSGAWHNWNNRYGENGEVLDGWVSYTWDEPVVLESTSVYYFQDGNGNFLPSAVRFEYLDGEGNWVEVPNPQGLGCAADQYNDTVFDKITTTSIRMTMAPRMTENPDDPSGGTGVLEWKVMGIYASELPDKETLRAAVEEAESKSEQDYTAESWMVFAQKLEAARTVLEDEYANEEQVSQALNELLAAMEGLEKVPEEGLRNLAPEAYAEGICDYVEDLGGLAALNDGAEPTGSGDTSSGAWHNWNNRYGENGEVLDGWVSYTWNEPVVLESTSVYYFQDGNGNFLPSAVRFEYLDGEGNWAEVPNPQGLGCAADQYNDTAFDKITTTSIRMTMAPRMTENLEDPSGGTGVLEWKVMGVYASEITVPVNKELLGSSLKTASQKEEKDYTPSSWEVFKAAYDAANKVYVDTEADQAAVDQAQTALDQAMNALVYRADFTEINALIARAEEKAEEDYTAESWSVFVQALENAKQAAENLEITQEELQKAYDSLAYAMENLQPEKEPEPPKVEKGALSALIQEAERRNEEDYTAESWSEMIRILEQAKAVAEKEDASQEEVDNMTALLSTALENLKPEEKPSESETLAALKELLKKASGLTEKDYTDESWKDFAAALAEAEKIAGKEDATPEEIQAALDSLQAAIDGLQPAAGEEPAEPSEEEKLAEQLAEAVEKGNGLTRADYTPESWAVFEAAQTEAQRVLEKGSEAGAEELQTALDALNAAINQLERVDGEQSLDTSKLEELIAKAEKLQKEDYTSATWNSLSQALDEAKAILKAEGASQADIDKKAQQLENAINSLKEKGTSSADSDKTTTGSSKNDSKGGTTDTRKGVKTGDNSPVWLYSGLAGLSGVVILGLILKTVRRKRNIKE